MGTGKGNRGKVLLLLQFFKQPADGRFGNPPAAGQVTVINQRASGMVAEIDDRADIGSLHLGIIVDCVDPHIQNDVHLRAFPHTDQFVYGGNGEKEKAGVLLARVIVFQRSIVGLPVINMEFYEPPPIQPRVGDIMLLLQVIHNGRCLVLEPGAEPPGQLR